MSTCLGRIIIHSPLHDLSPSVRIIFYSNAEAYWNCYSSNDRVMFVKATCWDLITSHHTNRVSPAIFQRAPPMNIYRMSVKNMGSLIKDTVPMGEILLLKKHQKNIIHKLANVLFIIETYLNNIYFFLQVSICLTRNKTDKM